MGWVISMRPQCAAICDQIFAELWARDSATPQLLVCSRLLARLFVGGGRSPCVAWCGELSVHRRKAAKMMCPNVGVNLALIPDMLILPGN